MFLLFLQITLKLESGVQDEILFFVPKTLEYFIIPGQLYFKVVLNTQKFPTLGTGGRQKLFCHVLGRERERNDISI
jgi:hypothetical protein